MPVYSILLDFIKFDSVLGVNYEIRGMLNLQNLLNGVHKFW